VADQGREQTAATGARLSGLNRDRLSIAIVLVVAAMAVFLVSRFEFGRAVGSPAESGRHFGSVNVFTDDPDAAVTVGIWFSADYRDYVEDNPLGITLDVETDRDEIRFVVVLSGDAGRTGIKSRSTSALPLGEERQAGDIWVEGADNAWYVNVAGPPVLVGRARRLGSRSPIEVSLVIPTNGRFFEPTATGFEFYMPNVGSPVNITIDPDTFAEGEPVTPPAQRLIEDSDWRDPKSVTGEVHLIDLRENDRVDATPSPTTFRRDSRIWSGERPLEVTGTVERASAVELSQRRQFLAGALVGLSGALAVWGLENLLEVSLDVRRTRRERRRKQHDEPQPGQMSMF
jgi:hypothetical protein